MNTIFYVTVWFDGTAVLSLLTLWAQQTHTQTYFIVALARSS